MAAEVALPPVDLLFEFATLNGGERSMLSVLRRLTADGRFRFRCWCPPTGPLADALQQLQIPIVEFAVRDQQGQRRLSSQLQAELQTACQQRQVHLMHANSLAMSRLLGQLPAAAFWRTGHLRDIVGLSRKALSDLNRNDALIAVSAATRDYHAGRGLECASASVLESALPRGCFVIHNGVDGQVFCPRARAEQRAQLLPQIPASATVLLSVGQICLRKAQLDTARAVVEINRQGADCQLVIAGDRHSQKAESVEFEQAIRQTFSSAGQTDRLHLLGYRNDIPRLMNAADVLVHAARQEPFGRVLLEAAACGLPIVATSVGGTGEILRADVDALLVPAQQPAVLGQAIRRIALDPELADQLAASARARILQQFTVDQAAARLADFWLRFLRHLPVGRNSDR